jgi:hypothetical protein
MGDGRRKTGEHNAQLAIAQAEIATLKKRVEKLEAELDLLKALVAPPRTRGRSAAPPPLPLASSKPPSRKSVIDVSDMAELLDSTESIPAPAPAPRPGPPRPGRR